MAIKITVMMLRSRTRMHSKGRGDSMLTSHDHFDILKSGVPNWNKWREVNTTVAPHLRGAGLREANLRGADLRGADLRGADLEQAHLAGANLGGAHLEGANLGKTHLCSADLGGAYLTRAHLEGAYLAGANLGGAYLEGTDLSKVKSFYKAILDPGILSEIKTRWPEKLATILDIGLMSWVIDEVLLKQLKSPDWHGWPEKEYHGK